MKTCKTLLIFVFLNLTFTGISAQSIIRQSINSFGSSNHTDGGLISETVGQVYFTNTFKEADFYLNPGFQQRMTAFIREVEIENKLQIKVYPNPVSEELYLLSSEAIKDARIEILDISGKIIFLSEEDIIDEMIISLGHISDGIYNIRVRDKKEGKSYNSRIIIIK